MILSFARGRDLVRNRILVALLVVVAGALWLTRSPTAAVDAVNGTFANPCCAPVRLDHGRFAFGVERISFTLSNMKFGLVAHPSRGIEVGDGNVVKAVLADEPSDTIIRFDDDRKGFTVLGPSRRVYHFVRR
jgi:hypothetical protein